MPIKNFIAIAILFIAMAPAAAAEFTAKSWLVMDTAGHVIEAEHQNTVRSVASITKLMTALVILDQNPDLEKQIKLQHGLAASKRISKNQKFLSVADLINLSIVASDNLAAANLCRAIATKKQQKNNKHPCVAAMNAKARSLGMQHTRFVEPTGLSVKNISTAEDLAKLVVAATKYSIIIEASKIAHGEIKTNRNAIIFKNTNPLVNEHSDILISKTGWTRAAGGCIAMLVGTGAEEKVIIILGSQSVRTRIAEANLLMQKNTPKDTHALQEDSINTNNNIREAQ